MIAKLQLPKQQTHVSDTAGFALAFAQQKERVYNSSGEVYISLIRSTIDFHVERLWEVISPTTVEKKSAVNGIDYSKYNFSTENLKFNRDEINER